MEDYVWFICNQKSCIPSLYIDPLIFEWFNRILKYKKYSKLIDSVWDITIKNVEYSDISVKLVQFKSKDVTDSYYTRDIFDELKECIQEMLIETKICMPWLPFKNSYCPLNEYDGCVDGLKQCGLWESVTEETDYYLNWIDQKHLKLFIYEEGAFASYKEILSKSIYKINCPLFITCAYPWHQSWYMNYFSYNTDFLAIYICSTEWKQMNLLQNFNIFDILSLDLALCDANDCLNWYVQQLFTKEFKYIKNFHTTHKFEQFDLERYLFDKKRYDSVNFDIYLYFLYSYGKNLRFINWSDRDLKNINDIKLYLNMILRSMFPNVSIQKNKYITLKSYKLSPERITWFIQRSKYEKIILDISNYKQFSLTMLNKLLKIVQIIRIEINVDLLQIVEMEPNEDMGCIASQKTIFLYSNTGGNVSNIEGILKYLRRFNVPHGIAVLSVIINNCIIHNYNVFHDFKLYSLEFQNMDISVTDLRLFCERHEKLTYLYFTDCPQFGDYHLIELLEGDLIIKRISIRGKNSVTINFYFMYAEQQIRTKKLSKFNLRDVLPIITMQSYGMFQNLTFIRNDKDGQIELRNNFNEPVDIIDLFYSNAKSDHGMYDFYT